jgi:hypothetical protein
MLLTCSTSYCLVTVSGIYGMYVCMYVCMHVFVCVCMHVCVCLYVCMQSLYFYVPVLINQMSLTWRNEVGCHNYVLF